jgi:hypothetical protein
MVCNLNIVSPYQGFADGLTLYCMDCVENPYTWYQYRVNNRANNPKCTYDYRILDGNVGVGVYQRVNRTNSELYIVTSDGKPPSLCLGCDQFCTDKSDPTCYELNNKGSFVKCLDGYYFSQELGVCSPCTPNCLQCSSSEVCTLCSSGFYHYPADPESASNFDTCGSCSQIPSCSQCSFSSGILTCTSCQR